MEKKKDTAQISVRLDRETLKKYKIWLIKHGYKSINQHLNEVIEKIISEEENYEKKIISEEENYERSKKFKN